MTQPPADSSLGNAAMLHYTWGILIEDAQKQKVWIFDKREYTKQEYERQVSLQPFLKINATKMIAGVCFLRLSPASLRL